MVKGLFKGILSNVVRLGNNLYIDMPYFKARKQKVNGLWYPQSQTLGQIPMDKIIGRLTQISTVSESDVRAVMGDMARVLNEFMDLGYSVKLEGLGSFYYTADASKQGVATEKEVSAKQIVGTRVRFIPEYDRAPNNATTRVLGGLTVNWQPFPKAEKEENSAADDEGGSTTPDTGGGDGGATGGNPL